MDHLFHKNILQEKSNLEWQLAEAYAKIEKLQRTLSSLEEKKQVGGNKPPPKPYRPPTNAPDAPSQPFQLPDGRWISPKPNRPLPPNAPFIAPWMDDDWIPAWGVAPADGQAGEGPSQG